MLTEDNMEERGESITVLHVDDDPDFAEMAATFLEREDERFQIHTATSADEGLARLAEEDYQCVVSDYDMPAKNGVEFLETVRENHPDLPFILYTGKGSEAVASDAISAGITDYLQKGTGTNHYTLLCHRIQNAVEQYRAKQAVERTERRYRRLIEESTDVITIVNIDGEFQYLSPAVERVLGYLQDEVRGEYAFDYIHPDDHEVAADLFTTLVENPGLRRSGEWRFKTADGDWIWLEVRGRNLIDDPAVGGIVVYSRDVTDRKEHERELQEQRDRYRSLFENNPLVIWEEDFSTAVEYLESITSDVTDVESYLLQNPHEIEQLMDRVDIIDVNQNAVDYYNSASKEALLENADQVFADEAVEALAAAWGAVAAGKRRIRTETVGRTFSGDKRHELLEIFVPETQAEDYSRVYVTSTDITDAKEQERRLRRQNERLDKFASVVSHDLRNPLKIANGRLELVQDECDSPHLEDIADSHQRMERLIDDLLAFARAGSEAIDDEPVALDQLATECWQTIPSEDATLSIETADAVRADRDRLQQLLENLLTNAVEHGGRDGAISIGELDDGFYIEDDGPGITEVERSEVFEAGYSSAEAGTGFGLSIVKQVAEAHGWEVSLTDGSTGGARFEITGVDGIE